MGYHNWSTLRRKFVIVACLHDLLHSNCCCFLEKLQLVRDFCNLTENNRQSYCFGLNLNLQFSHQARLDYQPLFGKMSPRSSPEGTAGVVSLALLISTNEKRACTNRAGINYLLRMQSSCLKLSKIYAIGIVNVN